MAKCDICYQEARNTLNKSECNFLELSKIETIFEQAVKIPNIYKRFHLAGGEKLF